MTERAQASEHGRIKFVRHRSVASKPGVDFLVRSDQQRLELVEFGFGQVRKFSLSERAEDKVDFLEAAPLCLKQ